ncbi:hypothetical protein P7C73_g1090, partial [Tremellales sp. Uapishka_1]
MKDATIESNVDARRALGRRPGQPFPRKQPSISFSATTNLPRLFIEEAPFENVPRSPVFPGPPSPSAPRALSLVIPTRKLSPVDPVSISPVSPTEPSRRFRRPTISRPKQAASTNRGLYETQKLLAHLLERLENRQHAPDLLERAFISAKEASGRSNGKGKGRVGKLGQAVAAGLGVGSNGSAPSSAGVGSEDYDERLHLEEGEWDTEETFHLVEQMRGLLVLAERQQLDLFGSSSEARQAPPSPTRLRRKTGRMSSVTSPSSPSGNDLSKAESLRRSDSKLVLSGPVLLSRLLTLLQSLTSIDCLHRTHLFRPLAPPYALQAACLDVATYLYHIGGLSTQLAVVETVVDGFYSMGEGMGERICAWLEGRMTSLLARLGRERDGKEEGKTEWNDPFAPVPPRPTMPTFSLSTDSPEKLRPGRSPGWVRYSPTSPQFPFPQSLDVSGILSTHATSELAESALRIAALVPRILVALTSTSDLLSSKLTTIHRVHRLLAGILSAKPDSCIDLLEIVALAPPIPRRTAMEILSTFYPESMGHNTISRRPALATYQAQRSKWETGQERALGEDEVENHHFIPWRCMNEEHCSECDGEIKGFAVKCTLCRDILHLSCYRPSTDIFLYDVVTLSAKESAPKTVYTRFSRSLQRLEEKIIEHSQRNDSTSTLRTKGRHELHRVNLFNLALCDCCRDPLWGSSNQAFACMSGCQRFFHGRCIPDISNECRSGRDVVVDEISRNGRNPFTISLNDLRSSYSKSMVGDDTVAGRSYDEISILHGSLWLQYQLFKNGISSGSLIILADDGQRLEADVLNLRKTLKAYSDALEERDNEASTAMMDYGNVLNLERPLGEEYLFSESWLTYCTALLKSPQPVPPDGRISPGLLSIDGMTSNDETNGSFECLELSMLCKSLASDLSITQPKIIALFLDQLLQLGLITVSRQSTVTETTLKDNPWCLFGLPLLIDSSPTVELLILSIEILLKDLDLTCNEVALRLLVNRAWPSLLCSPYALERLGNAVVAWVMAEDESLHEIVRDYASQRRKLPGVRVIGSSAKGSSSVSVYKEDRARLLGMFARPWLEALHEQDPALYAHVVYEQCKSASDLPSTTRDVEAASQVAKLALERIATLTDAKVVFSISMDLLTAWLEDLGTLADQDLIYKSLPRLLQSDRNNHREASMDIWAMAKATSLEGVESLERVCRWIRVLAFSGVEVPWSTLTELIELQGFSRSSVEARLDLVIAVHANGCDIQPEPFAKLCCAMFVGLSKGLLGRSSATELELLRRSLLLVLRSHGVPMEHVSLSSLFTVETKDERQPASVSKKGKAEQERVPVTLAAETIMAAARLLEARSYPDEVILDFLWLLFTKATLADNVDGFLHTQCQALYAIIWPLMGSSVDRRCRLRVFLKLLAVNKMPLEQLVASQLRSEDGQEVTEIRERLLCFALEIADESITSESTGWRASSTGLILLLFESLLEPAQASSENLAVINGLLPLQLGAISTCFEEDLVRSNDEQRMALLSRLQNLRLTFSHWPVLSWEIIENLLDEHRADITHLLSTSATVQATSALRDSQYVRSALLSLGLDMLSSGVEIPWVTLQRFQQHVASACALPWISDPRASGVTTLILPALRQVLDSSVRIPIGVHNQSKKTAMIGGVFVPVVIDLGEQLVKSDFTSQRCLLDILMVTFFKQNTRPVELAALSALQTLADFASQDGSVENRLLAISILQTAVSRLERESFFRAVPAIFAIMAGLMVKENRNDRDLAVLDQNLAVLDCFYSYSKFVQNPSDGEIELNVGTSLQNDTANIPLAEQSPLAKCLQILLNDEITGPSAEVRFNLFDHIVHDLSDMVLKRGRSTVIQVLGSFERFTHDLQIEIMEETAQNFGSFLNRLSKHIAEWDTAEFDPNSILKSSCDILNLVSSHSATTLLHQFSTFLHLCLSRFDVDRATIAAVLIVSERVSKRELIENTTQTVLFEISGSVAQGSPVTPLTLLSLLTFLNEMAFQDSASLAERTRIMIEASAGCMAILLRNHPALSNVGALDPGVITGVLTQAGMVIIQAESIAPGTLSQTLLNITTEINSKILINHSNVISQALDLLFNQEKATTGKIAKAIQAVEKAGLETENSKVVESLIVGIKKDLIANERLKALRSSYL